MLNERAFEESKDAIKKLGIFVDEDTGLQRLLGMEKVDNKGNMMLSMLSVL